MEITNKSILQPKKTCFALQQLFEVFVWFLTHTSPSVLWPIPGIYKPCNWFDGMKVRPEEQSCSAAAVMFPSEMWIYVVMSVQRLD